MAEEIISIMITLIHGNDPSGSRSKLKEVIDSASNSEIIKFEGNKTTLSEFLSATESNSIFMTPKTIIIEHFLKGILSKDKEKILEILSKSDHHILFWEDSELDKRILHKYFIKAKIYTISIPGIIFKFLDSLGMQNSKTLLSQFHEILKEKDALFVHVMLLRQWRLLILAKNLGAQGLSDLSPWQSKKFISQSRYFSNDSLIKSYRQLLQIEYKFKTGLTPLSFAKLLDIFLVTI